MILKKISIISIAFLATACVSGENGDVLQSAIDPGVNNSPAPVTPTAEISQIEVASIPEKKPEPPESSRIAFASEQPAVTQIQEIDPGPAPKPSIKKTYLINGLASSVESIGYGFTNLSKKIPNSKLHNYASFVESSTVIRSRVTRELRAAYKANPDIEINLIGISFGANIVTWIAQDLNRKDITINYLATLEGPAMARIYDNVRLADNFSCTGLNCFRTTSKLAWGNKKTDFSKFKIKADHIALANHPAVHNRVLSQINKPLEQPIPLQTVAQ